MTTTQTAPAAPFLAEIQQESAATRRLLERLPEDKLTWRPHPKSYSLGQLALHVATTPGVIPAMLQGESLDVSTVDFTQGQPANKKEILDAFVAEYGEKALMAPKPEGFNLWGYLLPGSVILLAGAGLFAFISRRRVVVAEVESETRLGAPAAADGAAQGPAATPDELERLRRALAEVED